MSNRAHASRQTGLLIAAASVAVGAAAVAAFYVYRRRSAKVTQKQPTATTGSANHLASPSPAAATALSAVSASSMPSRPSTASTSLPPSSRSDSPAPSAAPSPSPSLDRMRSSFSVGSAEDVSTPTRQLSSISVPRHLKNKLSDAEERKLVRQESLSSMTPSDTRVLRTPSRRRILRDDTVSVSTLTVDRTDEWLDHCVKAFADIDGGEPRSYFERHLFADSDPDYEGIQVVLVNGKIASTVRVLTRSVYVDGKEVPIGAINEVCTAPEFRKRGFAKLLMGSAVRYMRRKGMQVGYLHSSGAGPFYEKIGWKVVPFYSVERDGHVDRTQFAAHPEPSSELASPCPLAAMADRGCPALHASFSRRFNGPFVRTDAYWRKWIPTLERHGTRAFILTNSSRAEEGRVSPAIAYIIVSRSQSGLFTIEDFAYGADTAPAAGRRMFERLIAVAVQSLRGEDSLLGDAPSALHFTLAYPQPLHTLLCPPGPRAEEHADTSGELPSSVPGLFLSDRVRVRTDFGGFYLPITATAPAPASAVAVEDADSHNPHAPLSGDDKDLLSLLWQRSVFWFADRF